MALCIGVIEASAPTTRSFSAMLGNRLRKLFFDRMAAQDFTPNKDKVIHRILGLLPEGPESEKAKEEA